MDYLNVFAVSCSMALDSCCCGASDSIKENNIKIWKIILIALTFGIFQSGMSIIGYFVGYSFKDTVLNYIPWISFSILMLLGIKSIIEL